MKNAFKFLFISMTLATLFMTSTYAQVQDDFSDAEEAQEYEASEGSEIAEVEEEEAPQSTRRVDIGTPPPRRERINPYGGRENETREQTYCRYLNSLRNTPEKRSLLIHHKCL